MPNESMPPTLTQPRRVLLFGGSFDPVHHGHLIIARQAAEALALDRVILIPGRTPPHKTHLRLAPVSDRLEMCRRAVADAPLFEVSDWEARQPGPNYTLHTVQHFRAALGPDVALHWLIGLDSLHELGTWHRIDALTAACTIVTAARPGYALPDRAIFHGRLEPSAVDMLFTHVVRTGQFDISSTDIRARIAAGRSIQWLCPPSVVEYIASAGLYAAPAATDPTTGA